MAMTGTRCPQCGHQLGALAQEGEKAGEFAPKQEVRVMAIFEEWHEEGKDAYVRVEGIQQLVSARNLETANALRSQAGEKRA